MTINYLIIRRYIIIEGKKKMYIVEQKEDSVVFTEYDETKYRVERKFIRKYDPFILISDLLENYRELDKCDKLIKKYEKSIEKYIEKYNCYLRSNEEKEKIKEKIKLIQGGKDKIKKNMSHFINKVLDTYDMFKESLNELDESTKKLVYFSFSNEDREELKKIKREVENI